MKSKFYSKQHQMATTYKTSLQQQKFFVDSDVNAEKRR